MLPIAAMLWPRVCESAATDRDEKSSVRTNACDPKTRLSTRRKLQSWFADRSASSSGRRRLRHCYSENRNRPKAGESLRETAEATYAYRGRLPLYLESDRSQTRCVAITC